jgi:hypothetical protein
MTISPVTSQSQSSVSSSGGTSIAQLERKLRDLQKQLKAETSSKTDDAKTKAEKLKELQLEIQEVEMEIQQEQAKAAQQSAAKQSEQSNLPARSDATAASKKKSRNQYLDVAV